MTEPSQPHRRRGPKSLPKLPLSAFSPPNSGTAETFLPPPGSDVQPEAVIDANVVSKGDLQLTLAQWRKEAGQPLIARTRGIVLSLTAAELEKVSKELDGDRITSVIVPFDLENPEPNLATVLTLTSLPTSLSTAYKGASDAAVEGLRWALKRDRPVDIDIQAILSDAVLEGFEDTLTKSLAELPKIPPIVLSNILPPPHDLDLPIVKLMNHPEYLAFQSQIAALSLFPNVYIKFLPPSWDAPTPQTPYPGSPVEEAEVRILKEWKRRIKMYLSPVMEAFGYQRIIFGSSPSSSSRGPSNAGDWYEIARESLTELVVEKEFIDAVFCDNAQRVYGASV
ncbi:uncharacterized protein LACBIDRAFT_296283 [Laccaria bicolor S238N-H82]|uniref:Predicted protein n=1 Tax=Laccaria bicolor (strain S238N-H82 / ATCC MYA-4686) TaxID=486041 RepID=B0D8E8_LACBS|nr:uncharacterized protein LACBIDRAFT_296283 [Laccaria bicolor S238N-H82]EDR09065.1 predicted protein [Laccaria bicolor S238N-H82]|eukprot:XP_001880378.1 predicted protein [Laccaria bicolor S238N-H82]